MIVLSSLYNLLIGPLELFFEVLFAIAYRFLNNAGFSIIFISLAMNFLVLPLYRRADAMQEEERLRSMKMKPWIDHIKKTFKGDERFMMLQTYYRQCGYKQTDALKGSLSLMLEIPFFIAAFHFLSNLALLRGVQFGQIADLGAPDALLSIGDVTINVLPLLMTAINLVSGFIYLRGFPLKNKLQMYGITAIFLVLLYDSASGLVFYWTLNNVFSLVKNIFYKLKNPKRVLAALFSIAGIALLVAILFFAPANSARQQGFLIASAILLQIPLLATVLPVKLRLNVREATGSDDRTFLIGCILMALLTGLLIPLSVIQASPEEFVDAQTYSSPLWYLLDTFMVATGTFVIWFGVFYKLATPKGRSVFGYILWAVAGVAIVNYLFFGTDYGDLSTTLQYDIKPSIGLADTAINLAVGLAVSALLFVVWKKKPPIVRVGYSCMCIAVIAMTVYGMVDVSKSLEPTREGYQANEDRTPHFELSKSGENVVVIMMDRGVPYFLPYILNEKPELKDKMDGFTFYPNTISYGEGTNIGSPGLYGGYDYVPKAMNERAELSLREKHDQSLKVMPLLFSEREYDVTVFDPTYAGYRWTPDLSIYDDCPGVKAYRTMNGQFELDGFADLGNEDEQLSRNLFCYSLFRIAPLAAQPTLYNKGNYNSTAGLATNYSSDDGVIVTPQIRENLSISLGVDRHFIESYAVLDNLPSITTITEDSSNTFLMMSNDTTHEPMVLKEPEYVPAGSVDNTQYDKDHENRADGEGGVLSFANDTENRKYSKLLHYQINVAAWQKLCDWFDYLRAEGVYDNTRIIIVSDHGRNVGLDRDFDMKVKDPETGKKVKRDVLVFNCLLMVKDFNSTGFQVDNSFMTNADTPALALDGLVDNPVNPFTGNPIDQMRKYDADQFLLCGEWDIKENSGNTFLPGYRFSVRDNALDADNWEYLGYY